MIQAQLFHDRRRGLAVYKTTDQGQLLGSIGSAKGINDHFVAVPTDLYSLQICSHLGLPTPPIITDDNYEWPRAPDIKAPRASQKVMANFCVLHPKCLNLSDMGVGKTLATLWAADWLMRQYPAGEFRALIVAPLSTLRVVWESAIFKNFLSNRTCRVLDGSAERRNRLLDEPADFYIINFDGLKVGAKRRVLAGFARKLADRRDIKLVVVDEASAFKHANRTRHHVAREIFKNAEYLWLLTGTPTAQSHLNAFGLAKLVNNAHGESYTAFEARTTIPLGGFKRIPTQNAYKEAEKLLKPAIRYDLRDVWDGPELTTQQREVELTPDQKKLLRELKQNLVVQLENGTLVMPANEAVARTKYLQIVLGAIYDAKHQAHRIASAPRLNAMVELIEQAPSKLLVLSPLTSVVELLYRELNAWDREVVIGATSPKERKNIFDAFQSDKAPSIIIADPLCLAHGIDLFAARTTVWYGPTDKTEVYLQANRRMHRPGQRYPSTIVQMVATPLEREIYRRLDANQTLQGVLLNMVKEGRL